MWISFKIIRFSTLKLKKTDAYIVELFSVHSDENHAFCLLGGEELGVRGNTITGNSVSKSSYFVPFLWLSNMFICILCNFPFMIEYFKMNFGDVSDAFGLWIRISSVPLTHFEVTVVVKVTLQKNNVTPLYDSRPSACKVIMLSTL